jgi:hypothetical protein
MTAVPVISIDEIEDTFNGDDIDIDIDINNCHTDIEDLDSDIDKSSKRVTLISALKPSSKCNGAVTDVEDCEDSDDNVPDDEPNYEPEISLDEFLDHGLVDEHSNLQGNVRKQKLQKMQSLQKAASPTAFNLCVNTADFNGGATTDVEDMDGSGDDDDDEQIYSGDEKPIVLEDGNSIDVHDSMSRKKPESKFTPKIIEPRSSSSESEEEKAAVKNKPHKYSVKRGPRCEEAKSDIENIYLSDDDKRSPKPTFLLETPDIEVMAFEGSDIEDQDSERQFPEIDITFVTSSKPNRGGTKLKKTPAPSPMHSGSELKIFS